MRTKQFTHPALNDENTGEPVFYALPITKEICDSCDGHGKAFLGGGYDDSSMMDQWKEDGDFEAIENYYNGQYDGICPTCNGNNVVDSFDTSELPEEALKKIQSYEESYFESLRNDY